jgi:integrase
MGTLFRPTYPDQTTGKLKRLKRWYGKFRDAKGSIKKVPLSTNKAAAQTMLNDLLTKVERERAGLVDHTAEHATTPVSTHVAAWAADFSAGGSSGKHVRQTVGWVQRVIDETRVVFLSDLTAEKVRRFLADLRTDKPAKSLDLQLETYTRNELAALLDVKPFSVPSLVKRHRLEALGNGRSRRYPAATAAALVALRSRGMSAKAANHYLAAIQQFSRWLTRSKRVASDPLEELKPSNAEADRRRERRVLSVEDLRKMIHAARNSPVSFRGLSGRDRAALYGTALGTGFRAEEISCLTPGHFQLTGNNPNVYLSAGETKNGRAVEQPIPVELAAELREYLADQPDREPVWPGTWYQRAADMIRIDLEAACVPFVIEGRDGPLYADLHALRHSFVALLDQSGASLREAMQLARHSDPKLTMRVYGRLRLQDLGNAIGRLPSLSPSGTNGTGLGVLTATGTDGPHVPPHVPAHVPAGDSGRGRLRIGGESSSLRQFGNDLNMQGKEGEKGLARSVEQTPPVGFEPTTRRLTAGCSTAELSRNVPLQ